MRRKISKCSHPPGTLNRALFWQRSPLFLSCSLPHIQLSCISSLLHLFSVPTVSWLSWLPSQNSSPREDLQCHLKTRLFPKLSWGPSSHCLVSEAPKQETLTRNGAGSVAPSCPALEVTRFYEPRYSHCLLLSACGCSWGAEVGQEGGSLAQKWAWLSTGFGLELL